MEVTNALIVYQHLLLFILTSFRLSIVVDVIYCIDIGHKQVCGLFASNSFMNFYLLFF